MVAVAVAFLSALYVFFKMKWTDELEAVMKWTDELEAVMKWTDELEAVLIQLWWRSEQEAEKNMVSKNSSTLG